MQINDTELADAVYQSWLKVTSLVPRSPAYQAGVKARLLSLASGETHPRPSPRIINAERGTAEYDAFLAGSERGALLWIKFKYPEVV